MAINDTDKLLVNDGSKTETITFAQFKDKAVLNDTDKFLINDGTKTETITWAEIEDSLGPNGVVNTPTVLKPKDGAGSGDLTYLITDPITNIEGGGTHDCATKAISNVDAASEAPNVVLSFPDAKDFGCFADGDVVQLALPPNITVDSSLGTIPANGAYGEWANVFNGVIGTTGANENLISPIRGGESCVIEFNPPIPAFYSIKIYGLIEYDGAITINDGFQVKQTGGYGEQAEPISPGDIAIGNQLSKISVNRSSTGGFLAGVKVDDKLLFDPSVSIISPTEVKITDIKPDTTPPTITVDGGNWLGSDGSGEADGDTELTKSASYDIKLTVSGDKDLEKMTGAVFMSDGTPTGGEYSQTSYKLVTTDIESVDVITVTTYKSSTYNQNPEMSVTNAKALNDVNFDSDADTVTNASVTVGQAPPVTSTWAYFQRIEFAASARLEFGLTTGAVVNISYFKSDNPNGPWTFDHSYLTGTNGQQVTSTSSSKYWVVVNGSGEIYNDPTVVPDDINTSLNNAEFIVESVPSDTVLTFPGDVSQNPDLQYFRQNDLVQGTVPELVVTTNNPAGFRPDRPQANILDGDKTTRCDLATGNAGDYQYGIFVDIEALLGPDYMGQLTVYTNYNTSSDDGNRYKFYAVYTDDTESSKVNFNTGGGWKTVVSAGSKAIKYLVATAIDGRTPGLWTAIGTGSSDSKIITGDPDIHVVSTGYPTSNTMIVDGGDWKGIDGSTSGNAAAGWNQDETWSTGLVSSTGAWYSGRGPEAAFDGDTENWANPSTGNGSSLTWTPPSTLTYSAIVQIYTKGSGTHRFNGGTATAHEANEWVTIATGSGTITSIVVTGDNYPAWSATRIDGQLLVDDGVPGAPTPSGDTHVEYQTNGGTGTIVSVNTAEKTLLVANAAGATGDNRWIKGATDVAGNAGNSGETGNAANAEDFYVAGPNEVDSPLLTTNVWLESSAFSTTPETNPDTGGPLDALEKITWSITPDGGAEMIQEAGPSGTSNPYQPTGLQLGTWHTIKVKHEGLLLGESIGPWSTSTRFQTGASRSLKEHYVRQITALEQQLAAAQGTKTRSADTDEPPAKAKGKKKKS